MNAADLLLARYGIVVLRPPQGEASSDEQAVRAVELELAEVGHVASARLRQRLLRCSMGELAEFRVWALQLLPADAGGGQAHEPLFRNFPNGIPKDTVDLWWSKVLVHFLPAEGQPCLFCRRMGTTHVLDPCEHVVCDRCFDGANYSACPVCEHHVDRSSPFFVSSSVRALGRERVRFKLLDLGSDLEAEARNLLVSFCGRKQALSPVDRQALQSLVKEFGIGVLAWLPGEIPVRENVAMIFGTLLQNGDTAAVIARARSYLATPTDVLRLIAVFSGSERVADARDGAEESGVYTGAQWVLAPTRKIERGADSGCLSVRPHDLYAVAGEPFQGAEDVAAAAARINGRPGRHGCRASHRRHAATPGLLGMGRRVPASQRVCGAVSEAGEGVCRGAEEGAG